LREQLWRYFPALLELEDNLGAEWLLELWEAAPTPDTASRLCEATIAKLLKRHRIRRFDAAFVANTLCRPPVRVAAETVEAASASPDLENSELDPVAVRLARRKTECWANVSQCPVYVDSRRLLCANGGHSAAVWRAGQIDPKHAFPSWTRYGRSAPESSRRRYGQDSLSKLRTREFDPAWTALHWVFGCLCNAGWCGHVSDLFARHNGAADHNAICVQTP
jgi:hypothetical protein